MTLAPAQEIGQARIARPARGPLGRRRVIPITGGSFRGERLGALIQVRNFGYRHGPPDIMRRLAAGEPVDPSLYYMRTTPRERSRAGNVRGTMNRNKPGTDHVFQIPGKRGLSLI